MQIFVDILLLLVYFAIFFLILTYIWTFWKMYVTQKFLSKMNEDTILLEIKLPREITKSPESIELIVNAFQQIGGVGPWYNRNWKGALSSFFSLEIASTEGDVKFFVRTEKKYKEMIISNFYSQYDGIEIAEAPDYVTKIYYDHRGKSVSMVGADFKLAEKFKINRNIKRDKDIKEKENDAAAEKKENDKLEMPADFKMIKTYVDYKLDKDPKEEFKHDPLTPILEWLGSLKKGEHGWYQVILQEVTRFEDGTKFPKTYYNSETDEYFNLRDLAEERIKQIRKKNVKKITKEEVVKDKWGYEESMKNPKFKMIKDPNIEGKMISNGEEESIPKKYAEGFFTKEEKEAGYKYVDGSEIAKDMDLTLEEKDEIEMINRKLGKPLFRALIRTIFIGETEKTNFLPNLYSMYNTMRAFKGANGFFPFRNADPYDYNWQDVGKKRRPWRKEEIFESYVERDAFNPHIPFRDKAPNKFTNFFYEGGIDAYLDGAFFEKSLGYRKIFRLLYEGILHPFSHPHPNICTLNAEEVATIWHLPGAIASTPGIKRVDSLKSDAPTNLPR